MIRDIISYLMYLVFFGGMLVFAIALNIEMAQKGWQEFSMSARLRFMRMTLKNKWLKARNAIGFKCGTMLEKAAAKIREKATADRHPQRTPVRFP